MRVKWECRSHTRSCISGISPPHPKKAGTRQPTHVPTVRRQHRCQKATTSVANELDNAIAAAIALQTATAQSQSQTAGTSKPTRQRYDLFSRKITIDPADAKKYTNLFIAFIDIPIDAPDPALSVPVLPIPDAQVKRVFLSKWEARSGYVTDERVQALCAKFHFLDLMGCKLEGCEVNVARINLGGLDDLQKRILQALDHFGFNPHFEVREAAPRLQNAWANGLGATAGVAIGTHPATDQSKLFGS